jgi:hypothetical protein
MELEAKAFGMEPQGLEVKRAFEEFLGDFEAFKRSNDERLQGLEKRAADVLLEAARPALGGGLKAQVAMLTRDAQARRWPMRAPRSRA